MAGGWRSDEPNCAWDEVSNRSLPRLVSAAPPHSRGHTPANLALHQSGAKRSHDAVKRTSRLGAPVYAVVLLLGMAKWGARGAAAIILAGILVYGFLPTLVAFRRVLAVRRAARAARLGGAPPSAIVDDGEPEDPPDVAPRGV